MQKQDIVGRVTVVALIVLAASLALASAARAEDGAPSTAPPAAPAPAAAAPGTGSGSIVERFDQIPVEELDQGGGTPPRIEELGEVVITATRVLTPVRDVPRAVNVVTAPRVREQGVTSVVDALDDQIGIWVEKRTSHTSDPVIRGLSGGNLLALIDGNTLSTFWGEGGFAGDDMYGKINPDMVERIEVVRGPSSVLYGSNALGGVLNFITKESPFGFLDCRGMRWGSTTFVQANTDTSGWRIHEEVFGATQNLRWIVGVTRMDYGSTRDGGGETQTPTSARGWYADTHINWKVSSEVLTSFTVQYTNNDPVYRYYRPTQSNENERLAFAGWLEMPCLGRRTGFADSLRLGLYYQDKEDTRRWYDPVTKAQTRWGEAKWKTIQADLQLEKALGCHALTYGMELESVWGESPDDEQFTMHLPGGVIEKPAPDSVWSSLGAYVQDVWKISRKFDLTASLRFDVFRFETDVDQYYVPPAGVVSSDDEFTDWQSALVGGLQGSYHVSPETQIYGGWTRGFRYFAPKFGITEHAGFGVVVPTQLLDPVTADQFEVGVRHVDQHLSVDLVGYYTLFNNFQNLVRGTYQGQDWYDYNNNGMRDPQEDVYVTTGNGEAYVYGVELSSQINLAAIDRCFGEAWTVYGGFMWNYGQDDTNDEPLRHTHPMRGLVRLRWEIPKAPPRLWAEVQGDLVDRYDRIPPGRLASDVGYLEDPQDPASGMRRAWGLPGYSVWNLHAGFVLNDRVELSVGLDNIFDKLYRPAHARWDAPGRNFFANVTVTF